MRVKRLVRTFVPYQAVEGIRRVGHFGLTHRCDLCGAHLRTLKDQGYGFPILEQLQIVGGMLRRHDKCPVCHADDRSRLVKFWFDRNWHGIADRRMLHLAPEKGLTYFFGKLPGIAYTAGDLLPDRYWHMTGVKRVDLAQDILPAGAYGVIVANHILEHIPDDAAAMRNIHGALSAGGVAILQVPISLTLPDVLEGRGDGSPQSNLALYGQDDHVRIYTRESYLARLARAGFDVEQYRAFDVDAEAATRSRLNPQEILFVCRKRAASATA
jgi:SAM-dependent methyltransferase